MMQPQPGRKVLALNRRSRSTEHRKGWPLLSSQSLLGGFILLLVAPIVIALGQVAPGYLLG